MKVIGQKGTEEICNIILKKLIRSLLFESVQLENVRDTIHGSLKKKKENVKQEINAVQYRPE